MLNSNLAFQAPTVPQQEGSPGIAEIVIPDQSNLVMILPMLAYLSQQNQNRWFTWFPPLGISKNMLAHFGFNLNNVRVVYARTETDYFSLLVKALSCGSSDTVVASVDHLSSPQFNLLEAAAKQGSCQGILVKNRKA